MKKFAMIENGIVVNIIIWDSQSEFSCELELIEIKDDEFVDIGYLYNNGKFESNG